MLFLIETIIDFLIGSVLFGIGLSIGSASEVLGIALIAVGVMTASPKKLVSEASTYSEAQPWGNILLSVVLGALLVAGGAGIATKGGTILKREASKLVQGALIRRTAFIVPLKSYEKAWSSDFGGLTLGKGDELFVKQAILSPDGSIALVFYETRMAGDREEWMLTIDATTGEVLEPAESGSLEASAIIAGDQTSFRRWSYGDGLYPAVDGRKEGGWLIDTLVPAPPHDSPAAFAGLSGQRLKLYDPFHDFGESQVLVKEGDGVYSRGYPQAVEILRGDAVITRIELDSGITSRTISSWALSPDAATLAYSLSTLDTYRKYETGKEPDVYVATIGKTAEPRELRVPGRDVDWLEYSSDGKTLYTFDAGLRVLTALDPESGAELDRLVVYGRGRVDPAGISAHGDGILLIDEKAPGVTMYRRRAQGN